MPRDITLYGEEYKARVANPNQVVIGTTRPFRIHELKEQERLFKPLSWLFYYLASGQGKVGFPAADEWNSHYKVQYGLDVRPIDVISALTF